MEIRIKNLIFFPRNLKKSFKKSITKFWYRYNDENWKSEYFLASCMWCRNAKIFKYVHRPSDENNYRELKKTVEMNEIFFWQKKYLQNDDHDNYNNNLPKKIVKIICLPSKLKQCHLRFIFGQKKMSTND